MRIKAIIETDDFEDFKLFEDGNGKYMVGKDAGATASDEWIPLYFTECEQESTLYKIRTNALSADKAREDFVHDVYNTLDFLPTNDEANRIIDSFDRVTSGVEFEDALDKIRAEIEQEITYKPMEMWDYRMGLTKALEIIDKCKAEGGDK